MKLLKMERYRSIKNAMINRMTDYYDAINFVNGGINIPACLTARYMVETKRPKQIMSLYKKHKKEFNYAQ